MKIWDIFETEKDNKKYKFIVWTNKQWKLKLINYNNLNFNY